MSFFLFFFFAFFFPISNVIFMCSHLRAGGAREFLLSIFTEAAIIGGTPSRPTVCQSGLVLGNKVSSGVDVTQRRRAWIICRSVQLSPAHPSCIPFGGDQFSRSSSRLHRTTPGAAYWHQAAKLAVQDAGFRSLQARRDGKRVHVRLDFENGSSADTLQPDEAICVRISISFYCLSPGRSQLNC